jgi:TPR repeat protein
MYRDGEGIEQNDEEAKKWFLKAAEQGNEDAKNNLSN